MSSTLFPEIECISLIDVCCLFGSLKCFKYLLLNKCEITWKTLKYSITGANKEIINTFKEKGHSFEECLETSVQYHRYELTNWLNEKYKCEPISLPKCIEYYNLFAFFYYLQQGRTLDHVSSQTGNRCLLSALLIGYLPIVQHLILLGTNIDGKTKDHSLSI